VLLERLVDMRNSEGFRLVESSFTNTRPSKASSYRPNPSSSRAYLTWSLKWQTDILLKYTVYFNPYPKPPGSSSGYILGGADIRVDVVCNSDFMAKLNLNAESKNGSKTSGEVWDKRKDVLFNDPAKQLKHFLRVLREVDHMLVQVSVKSLTKKMKCGALLLLVFLLLLILSLSNLLLLPLLITFLLFKNQNQNQNK
jgi:hypothetical protein